MVSMPRSSRSSPTPLPGQAAIIILLIMVVALTLGLSIASRSTITLQTVSSIDASQRALTAAEAGVEDALKRLTAEAGVSSGTGTLPASGASFAYTVSTGQASAFEEFLRQDEPAQLDLTGDNLNSQRVTVNWHKTGTDPNTSFSGGVGAAVEYTLVWRNVADGSYSMSKGAYERSTNTIRQTQNNFTFSDDNLNRDTAYESNFDLTMPSGTTRRILRLRSLYTNTHVKVTSSVQMPIQTTTITSTGKVGDPSSPEAQRTVQVTRSLPALPGIFDYVLFSGSTTQPLSK